MRANRSAMTRAADQSGRPFENFGTHQTSDALLFANREDMWGSRECPQADLLPKALRLVSMVRMLALQLGLIPPRPIRSESFRFRYEAQSLSSASPVDRTIPKRPSEMIVPVSHVRVSGSGRRVRTSGTGSAGVADMAFGSDMVAAAHPVGRQLDQLLKRHIGLPACSQNVQHLRNHVR